MATEPDQCRPDGNACPSGECCFYLIYSECPDESDHYACLGSVGCKTLTLMTGSIAEVAQCSGYTVVGEVRESMSELEAHEPVSYGRTLERSREDVLNAARPLPLDGEMIIEELSEDEERLFLTAIRDL
jgi:hypothetical protein